VLSGVNRTSLQAASCGQAKLAPSGDGPPCIPATGPVAPTELTSWAVRVPGSSDGPGINREVRPTRRPEASAPCGAPVAAVNGADEPRWTDLYLQERRIVIALGGALRGRAH
jgi:hypothetical protein